MPKTQKYLAYPSTRFWPKHRMTLTVAKTNKQILHDCYFTKQIIIFQTSNTMVTFTFNFRSDYQPCEDSGLLRSATFNGMWVVFALIIWLWNSISRVDVDYLCMDYYDISSIKSISKYQKCVIFRGMISLRKITNVKVDLLITILYWFMAED